MAVTERQEVPEDLAFLLNRVQRGWVSLPVPRRVPSRVVWGARDLSPAGRTLRVVDHKLTIGLELESTSSQEDPFLDLAGSPIAGATDDGALFQTSSAIVTEWTGTWDPERPNGLNVIVESQNWTITDPVRPPRAWIGELEGEAPESMGNLLLASMGGGSIGHHRLQGTQYDYYLLVRGRSDSSRPMLLVVDSKGSVPDSSTLRAELTALAFSFGQPLRVRSFRAVDIQGRTVGAMGADFGVAPTTSLVPQPPVPAWATTPPWVVPFFERLVRYALIENVMEEGNLTLALWYFLDSLNERTADGRQLKVFLALAAVARQTLGGAVLLVADQLVWKQWVETHRGELRAMAPPGIEDTLVTALEESPPLRTSDLIHAGAGCAGLTITREMTHALQVAQSGLFGVSVPLRGLWVLLPHLHTLLFALVAKRIGYDGPITGWEKHDPYYFFRPAPTAWWPQSTPATPVMWEARTELHPSGVEDLWPPIQMPTVPVDGLVGLVSRFAGGLEVKTNGMIAALVQPVPNVDQEEPKTFQFVIQAVSRPGAQTVLFSMVASEDGLEIQGSSETRVLTDDRGVENFLKEVATSSETTLRIQRLLLLADSAARGAR